MSKQFKIGEVADLLGINTSAIRFWETKFNLFHDRSVGRHRYYSEEDVKTLQQIHKMLKQDHYTIAGARMALKQNKKDKNNPLESDQKPNIISTLHSLKNLRDYVKLIQDQIDSWEETDR